MIAALCSRYGVPSWDFNSTRSTHPAGASPLEKLPSEILSKVLLLVTKPVQKSSRRVSMPESINTKTPKEDSNLFSVLLTSRKLYETALPILYRSPLLTSPTQFSTFVSCITNTPSLGPFIRTLDLTQLAPSRSVTGPWDIKSNSSPLSSLLSQTPLLRFLAIDQYLADEVDAAVLNILLHDLKVLEVLQFNNCNSPTFTQGLCDFFGAARRGPFTSLARLSLRGCAGISADTLSLLLGGLPRLRDLDLSATQVTVPALSCLPDCVRLEELDLSYCEDLDGGELAEFLNTHVSLAEGGLKGLSIAERPDERSFSVEDLSRAVSSLPRGIREFNARNTGMESCHVEMMRGLGLDLEILSVGSQVKMRDLESLFLGNNYRFSPDREQEGDSMPPSGDPVKHQHESILSPMEKAIKVCKLRQRLSSIAPKHTSTSATKQPLKTPALRYLDISSMAIPEQGKIQRSVLLGAEMGNLEVIEISRLVLGWSEMLGEVCRCVGWKVKFVGRRCWLERV